MKEMTILAIALLAIAFSITESSGQTFRDYQQQTCASDGLQHVDISCESGEFIFVLRALYVKPDTSEACTDQYPVDSGDLALDVSSILTVSCVDDHCRLPLDWQAWDVVTASNTADFPGNALFVVDYRCQSYNSPLPVFEMVSSTIRMPSGTRVYGCHRDDPFTTGLSLACNENQVLQIGRALIGKAVGNRRRCYEADIDGDVIIDLGRTVSHVCQGSSSCYVPVDWQSVETMVERLQPAVAFHNNAFLDITYQCVDSVTEETTIATVPDVVGGPDKPPLLPGNDSNEEGGSGLSTLTLGGIGLLLICLVAFGFIFVTRHFRQRRQHRQTTASHFIDPEPTYRTSVIRSEMAPQSKFSNIIYDSERHPSGVYDVPSSATTTPGTSRVTSAIYANNVKVDIEDDDDDVIVPVQSEIYKSVHAAPFGQKEGLKNARNMSLKLPSPGLPVINPDLYADLLKGDKSKNDNGSEPKIKTAASCESIAPQLPPRTQSMLDETSLLTPPTADDVTRPQSLQLSIDSNEPYANAAAIAMMTSSTPLTPSPAAPSPQYQNQQELTTDHYRSVLRHQPISGDYDNNMDNMPSSPYCMKPVTFPY